MKNRKHNWGKSPWRVEFRPKRTPLPREVDFAVIGGGFAGLSAAAWLKRLNPAKSVVVLEAESLGAGASGRTGGMALSETAAGNLRGLGDVLGGYRNILRALKIEAELYLPGAWELGRTKGRRNSAISWSDSGNLRVVNTVAGGTVHPGKVVAGLARAAEKGGVRIFERAEVTGAKFGEAVGLRVQARGKETIITAKKVLFATNAGWLELAGLQRIAEPQLTMALQTERLSKRQIMALGLASRKPFYTVDFPYLWGRLTTDNCVIFGAGLVPIASHAQKSVVDVNYGEAAERLRWLEGRVRGLHPILKNVRVTHRWGGPILFTPAAKPVFRRHRRSRHAVVLAGFNGHGVALSVYLGKWAAEAMLGLRELPRWTKGARSKDVMR